MLATAGWSKTRQSLCVAVLCMWLPTCQAFRLFDQARPRAAFVYLVHSQRTNELTASLASLQSNFLSLYKGYHVLLFHNLPMPSKASLVPSNMAHVRWIELQGFDNFPAHYQWQEHASQRDW